MLCSRQPEILPQHLKQRLVRREGDLGRLAVDGKRDLDLRFGSHGHIVILIRGRGGASLLPMTRLISLAAVVSIVLTSPLAAQDYRAQAIRILGTVPLIDGHNDIPDAVRERRGPDSVNFAVSQPKLMTDIPRLRSGHVGGQFWAAYVPVTTMDSGPHPAVYALEQIDLIHRLCAKNPRSMAMAYTAADVQRNFTAGYVSCLIGIEGGHAIENSLGALRMF